MLFSGTIADNIAYGEGYRVTGIIMLPREAVLVAWSIVKEEMHTAQLSRRDVRCAEFGGRGAGGGGQGPESTSMRSAYCTRFAPPPLL